MGLAFLRKLRERYLEFKGRVEMNCWMTHLQGKPFQTRLGYGRVLIGADGLPVAFSKAFVDDFFLHAPNFGKLERVLRQFLGQAVEVGLLCNPEKAVGPSQIVKYCGFLYDTTSVPSLRIPTPKRTKALAVLDYIQSFRGQEVPCLLLAIVAGVLQALVDATPSRIGQTFLRRLHDQVHIVEDEVAKSLNPAFKYYFKVVLGEAAWMDLEWWRLFLLHPIARTVRPL